MSKIRKTGEQIESWDESLDDPQPSLENNLQRLGVRYLLDEFNPTVGESLLDVGCGQGDILVEAVSHQVTCTGLEVSPAMAVMSQKTAPQAKVVIGNGMELPFESESFDWVTSINLCNYFVHPAQGLLEIQRVLKKQGRALLLLANADYYRAQSAYGWQEHREQERIVAYSYKIWSNLIKRSGMKLLHLQPLWLPTQESGTSERMKRAVLKLLGNRLKRFVSKKWCAYFICCCFK